jgi:hypothetical protein
VHRRAEQTNRQQSSVLAFRNPGHFLPDDFDHLARCERAEHAHHVIGEVLERKEAGDGQQAQEGREERQEKVIRELRRQSLRVVARRFMRRAFD